MHKLGQETLGLDDPLRLEQVILIKGIYLDLGMNIYNQTGDNTISYRPVSVCGFKYNF